jgi:hypothetical protein
VFPDHAVVRHRRDVLKLWLPNAKLAENPLTNVSRSGDRWEGFKVITSAKPPSTLHNYPA